MEERISGRKPSYGFFSRLVYGVGEIFGGGCFVIIVQHALGAYPAYYIPILAVLMVAQLVGMLIFGPVMSKTSKKLAIVIAAPLRLAGVLGLLAFSHHGAPLVPILALASLIGLGNAGSLTGIFAIMADMTDIDDVIVGTIGAYDFQDDHIEVDFSVVEGWRGRGFATEALKKVLEYLTENERIPRVTAWCAAENIGSRKVLKKAGMQLIQIEKGGLVVGDRIYDRLIHEYRAGANREC